MRAFINAELNRIPNMHFLRFEIHHVASDRVVYRFTDILGNFKYFVKRMSIDDRDTPSYPHRTVQSDRIRGLFFKLK
jgi:hypothetical protein